MSEVNYYMPVLACSLTRLSWLRLVFKHCSRGQRSSPFIRRCMPSNKLLHMKENLQARQIRSGGGGGARAANMPCDLQSVVLSEIWWSKQIGCWVLSNQQLWKHSSVDGEGWWSGGRHFPQGKVHLPQLVFTSIIQISSSLSCCKLSSQIWDMLQDNVDVYFPTREKNILFWCLIWITKSPSRLSQEKFRAHSFFFLWYF